MRPNELERDVLANAVVGTLLSVHDLNWDVPVNADADKLRSVRELSWDVRAKADVGMLRLEQMHSYLKKQDARNSPVGDHHMDGDILVEGVAYILDEAGAGGWEELALVLANVDPQPWDSEKLD